MWHSSTEMMHYDVLKLDKKPGHVNYPKTYFNQHLFNLFQKRFFFSCYKPPLQIETPYS